MLAFLLWLVGSIAYATTGYVLADLSLRVWLAKDNRSARAFLLFPVSYYKRRIGQHNVNVLSCGDFHREAWDENGVSLYGRGLYTVVMLAIWPLKAIINLPFIAVLLAFVRLSRSLGSVRSNVVYGANDVTDVPRLYAQRRDIVEEIALLEQAKRRLDEQICESKRYAGALHDREEDHDRAYRSAQLR